MVAGTISNLLATRYPAGQFGFQWTEYPLDEDYNRLEPESDEEEPDNGVYRTPIYATAADSIHAETFEKLFFLISTMPHQAILLWHQVIQGILTILLFIVRLIKLIQI